MSGFQTYLVGFFKLSEDVCHRTNMAQKLSMAAYNYERSSVNVATLILVLARVDKGGNIVKQSFFQVAFFKR